MSAVGDVDVGAGRVVCWFLLQVLLEGFASNCFFLSNEMESFLLKWTVSLLSETKPSVWLLSEKNFASVFVYFSLQPETNGAPSLLEYTISPFKLIRK